MIKMKRIATALLASTIMMSSLTCMPLAEDTTQTTSQTGVQSTTVTYRQDSTFTVSIPKTITLDSSKTATYNVNVKGDIAGDDIIVVKPDKTVTMSDSNGKSDVTATITQQKTDFTMSDLKANSGEGNSTTGTVSATDLTAGSWTGTLNFDISLNMTITDSLPGKPATNSVKNYS